MNKEMTFKNRTGIEICRQAIENLIKELIIYSDKYGVTPVRFNTLVKAYYTLESFPVKKITGYIDISANTHLSGGALDYNSLTIGEDYFEIYTGFVKYDNGECDDSSWERIYSSKDPGEKKNLSKAIECWVESFMMHLDENPSRSLLIIDRSELKGDSGVYAVNKPNPTTGAPEYSYEPVEQEYSEVPF